MPDRMDDGSFQNELHRRMGNLNPWAQRRAKIESDNPELAEMRANRKVNQRLARAIEKTGSTSGTGGGSPGAAQLSFATGRPRDPFFYWKENNLPWDPHQKDHLERIRAYCRLLYQSDPIIGSCVDIYSKFPLLGMELNCKDEQLTEFYSDLFFNEEHGLDYEEFLIDMGREYWTVGEAWPFGSFNETLGVWEDDELLNPDDCEVLQLPFNRDPSYLIRLPESLRTILTEMQPRWEYNRLMTAFPELKNYSGKDALMPVSNMLLRQIKFKGDTFNKRGVPLLMRAFRTTMQQEMLNAAMDAIADRLYTPLILAKLGASATDLGTQAPWIPTPDDLADFEEALDGALAADFRVLTYHFGLDMAPVLGREQMPNLNEDFDRIEDRILQTFGLSRTMLNGASGGETYAADALNRDLISQLLTTWQKRCKAHYRQRALIVAEAQEHYDYEERNGRRYVKMEEILEVDEETGEERIVEQPKLLIPDMNMKTMNMADETVERQFIEGLASTGVPISYKSRMTNIPFEFEEEVERRKDEEVKLIVAEAETKREAYLALVAANLPIPADLEAAFRPKANNLPDEADGQQQLPMRIPALGMDPVGATPNLTPSPMDQVDDGSQQQMAQPGMAQVIPMPTAAPGQSAVPPESNEQRGAMPKPAKLTRTAHRIKEAAAEHQDERPTYDEELEPQHQRPHGKFGTPAHVGMRRHAADWSALAEVPMDQWDQEDSA